MPKIQKRVGENKKKQNKMAETLGQVNEEIIALNAEWMNEAEKLSNKSAQRRARVFSTKLCKLHKRFRELSKV